LKHECVSRASQAVGPESRPDEARLRSRDEDLSCHAGKRKRAMRANLPVVVQDNQTGDATSQPSCIDAEHARGGRGPRRFVVGAGAGPPIAPAIGLSPNASRTCDDQMTTGSSVRGRRRLPLGSRGCARRELSAGIIVLQPTGAIPS
jgi:hypothetical protein